MDLSGGFYCLKYVEKQKITQVCLRAFDSNGVQVRACYSSEDQNFALALNFMISKWYAKDKEQYVFTVKAYLNLNLVGPRMYNN